MHAAGCLSLVTLSHTKPKTVIWNHKSSKFRSEEEIAFIEHEKRDIYGKDAEAGGRDGAGGLCHVRLPRHSESIHNVADWF